MSFKLTPSIGCTKVRKRIGRGNASGQGRTAGKGHNGYQSRSGTKAKLHFEGGQTPLARRLPKRGMKIFSKSYRHKMDYQIVNLKDLSLLKITKIDSKVLFDKGIKDYCLAAERVREKLGNKVKFKLSGPIDNASPTSISEYEVKKLSDKYEVEYLGNREDMPELLASALIFVLPSYYPEGLPKVLCEAAASGVPIITTDHPGCRDAIVNGETGLLVAIKDPDSLAFAIIELLTNDPLLEHMSKQARLLAEKSFRDSSVVNDHYSLYHQLI